MIYTKVEAEKGKLKEEIKKLNEIVFDRDEEIKKLNAQLHALNKGDHVTFRDGGRGKIVRKVQLCVQGLPYLDVVLLVEGLIVNLIRISQLCDDGMQVYFSKDGCTINDSCDQTIMKEARSAYNYYVWTYVKALVLDQGLETIDEDVDVGRTTIDSPHDSTSKVIDGDDPGSDNSCDDICSIQPANRIQKNHPVNKEGTR
ncbi:hypothetical protein LIER_19438 [Lithospermum erythrorhizon]|uniref:Uncharacterized protein n=1 Tax=Lithospermum erythrorhizon TaxID=34254 RepID=A0AAV3QND0_LITER